MLHAELITQKVQLIKTTRATNKTAIPPSNATDKTLQDIVRQVLLFAATLPFHYRGMQFFVLFHTFTIFEKELFAKVCRINNRQLIM